jgi:hypothetical protein
VTEIVQFSRATKYLLSGLLPFLILVAALIGLSAGPWLFAPAAFLVLLWWRLLALKVVFASDELVLVGLVSVRRIPRANVNRVEEGTVVVLTEQDRERRVTIPIAMSASGITDNTPDAQVKQRIDAAYQRWVAASAKPASGRPRSTSPPAVQRRTPGWARTTIVYRDAFDLP